MIKQYLDEYCKEGIGCSGHKQGECAVLWRMRQRGAERDKTGEGKTNVVTQTQVWRQDRYQCIQAAERREGGMAQ